MAGCFSTRASEATVLTTHPCISRWLRVNVHFDLSCFCSFCCWYWVLGVDKVILEYSSVIPRMLNPSGLCQFHYKTKITCIKSDLSNKSAPFDVIVSAAESSPLCHAASFVSVLVAAELPAAIYSFIICLHSTNNRQIPDIRAVLWDCQGHFQNHRNFHQSCVPTMHCDMRPS